MQASRQKRNYLAYWGVYKEDLSITTERIDDFVLLGLM
jgi:hypothetical protein